MKRNNLVSKLEHRIYFHSDMAETELDDPNWVEAYSCMAEIKPMYDNKFGSIENFSFGLIVTEAYFMFKIRFSKKIDTKMRIHYKDRIFEIKRIINASEKNILQQIIALEI